MRSNTLRIFLCLAIAGLVGTPSGSLWAEEATGGLPGDWLANYSGARSVGLGGAYVTSAQGPLGSVWNPAGLTNMFQNEAHFETVRLFEDTSINSFGFAVPARRFPSFGLTIVSMRSGEFERTSELNEPLGSFTEGNTAFLLTAAKSLSPRLSIGTNLKFVRQSVEDFSAGGMGVDLGAQFHVNSRLSLGTSILNLGGPNVNLRDVDEKYPTEFRGGFAVRFLGGRALLSGEMDRRGDLDPTFHAGSEFWIHPSMALRAGYDADDFSGGFSYRLASGAQLDYGVSPHELGTTHRVAVSFRFGGFFAASNAVPEVFSPTGERSITKFHLKSRTKAEAASWQLLIHDKSGEVIRRFGGQGLPPAHVLWDGKDETGLPLADGQYRYLLVVRDEFDREIRSKEQVVEILTEGPRGSVPVMIDDNDR